MTGRILILDGVATNRIMLRVKLAAAFYEVTQAATGAAALAAIGPEAPDLVIVSGDLPDMSGESFCRKLRADRHGAAIPAIVVHAAPDARRRLAALTDGADDVMARPLDDLVLLARVRSLLRARDAEAELRLRDDTQRALGLAEEPAAFDIPARIVLVPAGPDHDVAGAALSLDQRLSHRVERRATEAVLRDDGPAPDLYVIVESALPDARGLQVLSQLRASSGTRHAAIVYVAGAEQRREAATALDLGADDLMSGGLDIDELEARLPRQIARKRTTDRLRANMRDGLKAAVTDPLTGLFNRRYAMPHIARLFERARSRKRPMALLLLDIDHFKQINDRHGHAGGDEVLVAVSRLLRDNLRATDMVSRIGGEEFLIAMPDTGRAAARRSAERLCRALARAAIPLSGGRPAVTVTASVGIALSGRAGPATADALLAETDVALYAAKDAGRNRAVMAGATPRLPVLPTADLGTQGAPRKQRLH